MTAYRVTLEELRAEPRRWLVTGCAGFIGSHLVESLLRIDQTVVGLDNLSTGSPVNLDLVRAAVTNEQWLRFEFHRGSVADIGTCREVSNHADYILHMAGFVSVPLSIEDPIACHDTNVTGTLNMLVAARDNRARRFIYASSSAVYGDDPRMPKTEDLIASPVSPYGASKFIDEIYAAQFHQHYGVECIGLRYFNIFGPRQNPFGGYAAVIPQWILKCVRGETCTIHGDGSITRDFCPVANVVQANILAATTRNTKAIGQVYNVGLGGSTRLDDLHRLIAERAATVTGRPPCPVDYGPPRPGDIHHSSADISRIREMLRYAPEVDVPTGLDEAVRWYAAQA